MKVFISQSGSRSRYIAETLRDWLPTVIQSIKLFVSSRDIDKGARALDEIDVQLKDTNFGIVCLTPENLEEKWIHFEAGALSKTLSSESGRVWTYLYGLKFSDVQGPLSRFQHTICGDKADTSKLVTAINKASGMPLEEQVLEKVFERSWREFDEELRSIPPSTERPPRRSTDSMLEEILELLRNISRERDGAMGLEGFIESVGLTPSGSSLSPGTLRARGVTRIRGSARPRAALEDRWISVGFDPSSSAHIFRCPTCDTDVRVPDTSAVPLEVTCPQCDFVGMVNKF